MDGSGGGCDEASKTIRPENVRPACTVSVRPVMSLPATDTGVSAHRKGPGSTETNPPRTGAAGVTVARAEST